VGEPAALLSTLSESVRAAVTGGWRALDQLVDQLLAIDRTGDAGLAAAALARLRRAPRVVVRLDEHARRVDARGSAAGRLGGVGESLGEEGDCLGGAAVEEPRFVAPRIRARR
jgi:hypothetical protein